MVDLLSCQAKKYIMYGYIYKFTLIPTGLIYVGKRKSETFDENYYGSGKKWKKEIINYSKSDIQREILQWCETEEELNTAEKFWIEKLDARNSKIGYNISKGGQNPILCGKDNARYGKHWDNEFKQKQRERQIEYANTHDNPMSNPEYRKRVSKGLKGHSVSNEAREKLRYYNTHKIFITNGEINKTILPEFLEEWKLRGFYIGTTKKLSPKKVWVVKDNEEKLILESELSVYLELGYIKGRLNCAHVAWNKGRHDKITKKCGKPRFGKDNHRFGVKRFWLTNGKENKQVRKEELDHYLKLGFIRGRTRNGKK